MLPAALLLSSPVVSLPCAAGNSIQQIGIFSDWDIGISQYPDILISSSASPTHHSPPDSYRDITHPS